eukprot:gene13403-14779_t
MDCENSPKKRRLTFFANSPSPSKKSASSSTMDFTGYIISVAELDYSQNGNPFYDIHIKTSIEKTELVRVMVRANPGVKRQLFLQKQASAQPITLKNIEKTDSGTSFFNSFKGSCIENCMDVISFKMDDIHFVNLSELNSEASGSFNIRGNLHWTKEPVEIQVRKKPYSSGATMPKLVREGIIADITAHYPISIWSDHVNLPDDTWYTLTDVVIKNYQGKKLQTTPRTTVLQVSSEDTIDWATILPEIEKVEHPSPAKPSNAGNSTLQNVDITSVKVNTYPQCANSKCKKKVLIIPGENVVKCNSCERKMLPSKCPCGLNCIIDVVDNENEISLTIFPTELGKLFREEIIESYGMQPDLLEEKILMLNSVDVTFNKKNVVTKIAIKEKEDSEEGNDP